MIIESLSTDDMPLWKARQNAFYAMNDEEDFDDDLKKHDVIEIERHELAFDIIHHFKELPPQFRYPSKSYVVAMVYARLLSEYFGGDKMSYLDDPELLFDNDPYFVPYSEDKECYDKIIETIGWEFDLNQGTPAHVVPYFIQEFLITKDEQEKWHGAYS